MTTIQTIEVEGLPKGWMAVAYRIASNENVIDCGEVLFVTGTTKFQCLVVEKIQPRRMVLEETGEERAYPINGYMYGHIDGSGFVKYKILREVKETDIPLTNEEPYLKLTKKDMFYLIEHIKLGGQLNQKIAEFIKDK